MKIIRVKDDREMSKQAARRIIEQVRQNPESTLGLATGGTPEGTYKELIKDYQENQTSYKQIRTFNLDEYVGLAPDDPNSYHFYMNQNLFDHIDIPSENIHLPNGLAEDLEAECQRYDDLIAELDGIDLQILGIGENGHIGFNEPGTSFQSHTHVETLTESTREANARYFESLRDVPTHALTMGISTILLSREILLMASGEHKAEAIYKLFYEDVDEQMPASILKTHDNVTLIADEQALSRMEEASRESM
ncbi:glucosamine-6-phosphate deaminase [Salinibacillus xinjiangensis]|uniref:Glucosamine-6-phosphate deaminase n=1 Tax=Salinibacillus xinjiangensis TaxID=1229268 RepID=A0A6G1X9Z7_9BACI|nr:glucosamine-6-phosphate deaminase [Salinibacillus xinjiangensis]MRG87767.1 glucosamine-6-phosphate deaminase [Salinibacillus xinjiangensis]